jgi:hypothetical protein
MTTEFPSSMLTLTGGYLSTGIHPRTPVNYLNLGHHGVLATYNLDFPFMWTENQPIALLKCQQSLVRLLVGFGANKQFPQLLERWQAPVKSVA